MGSNWKQDGTILPKKSKDEYLIDVLIDTKDYHKSNTIKNNTAMRSMGK